jgi:hypothetical protein
MSTINPQPKEFQEKAARLGYGGWYPTPGVTDEDKELYISLGERHIHVISIAEALTLSDEALQQRIDMATGMTFEESCERYGVAIEDIPNGVPYAPAREVQQS